jgi:ABC-2 type transport system permease protein
MRAINIIFRRELGAYFRSPFSWVLAAFFLLLTAVLFQAFSLGIPGSLSTFVLERYFYWACVATFIAGATLTFRAISEERSNHSMVLLNTSPVRDSDIILGKFFASFVFLALMIGLSLYMPLMLKIGNKISLSQILVGYFGLLLAGSVALAVGLFASSLTRYMLVAASLALVILGPMALFATRALDPGIARDVLVELDVFITHFVPSFSRGILNLKDVIYYVAVTYFFLVLAIKTLEAKRWQ